MAWLGWHLDGSGTAHRIDSITHGSRTRHPDVISGRESEFEVAFSQARRLISAMPGFLSLELGRNTHIPNRYVLLVKWRSVEDHREGFRRSQEYVEWSRLLHHFYEPFPTVEYYRDV